jgi:hypothetical protein
MEVRMFRLLMTVMMTRLRFAAAAWGGWFRFRSVRG